MSNSPTFRLYLSILAFPFHFSLSQFATRTSLSPIRLPEMRGGRSAGIGARGLRVPARACHDRQAGASLHEAPCVRATLRSPLGTPPWRFLWGPTLGVPHTVPGAPWRQAFHLAASGHIDPQDRRPGPPATRLPTASPRAPHPAPPNRTASAEAPLMNRVEGVHAIFANRSQDKYFDM